MDLMIDVHLPSLDSVEAGAPVNEIDLNPVEMNRLARALFEEQERLLPENETWDGLDDCDRLFWEMSVEAVIRELKKLRGG